MKIRFKNGVLFFVALWLSFSVIEAKKVLVTGGAGFLGSHLCERLLAEGDDVLCMDNLYTGSINNIRHLVDDERFMFILHDVIDPFPENMNVDEIYNLACPASPVHYQSDPIKTFQTSVMGAFNVLELARRYNAKIFQASTSEIYGDPLEHPQKESYWGNVNTIGIRSCYDEGKRGAETLFFDYHRVYGVNIKVGRIFNTYGPRMSPNDGRVVSNFIVQALADEPITLYGDGEQTRSFCYVDDLVKAMILFMRTPDDFHGPMNMGNPHEFTVKQLAEKVIALTGSKSEIIYMPLPQDDPRVRKPDISLAKKMLGWQPQVDLNSGLQSTIEYFRSLNK